MVKLKNKKSQLLDRKSSLACIPEKSEAIQEVPLDSGDLILVFEAVYQPVFLKALRWLRPGSSGRFTRKIQLDALGRHVWSLIDGSRTVQEITKRFSSDHGLNIKEAELSVAQFLRSLGKKGLVWIRHP